MMQELNSKNGLYTNLFITKPGGLQSRTTQLVSQGPQPHTKGHSYTVYLTVIIIFLSQKHESILSDLKFNISTLMHEM